MTTGLILLELHRGFVPDRAQQVIRRSFEVLEFIEPHRADYIDATAIGTSVGV